MIDEATYKKEVQNRKKEFEDKKVKLMSRQCIDEEKQRREGKLDS